ncbi:transmembrane protein, partial [Thalictrum thalictroides]
FYLESLEHKKNLLKQRFRALTEKLKYHVQEQWMDQHSTKQFLVHVVKQGETLTSISRLYGVSLYSIALFNEKVVDINIVFEGQRLNIPLSGVNNSKSDSMWKIRLYYINARDSCQRSLNNLGRHDNLRVVTMLSSHHLPPAKTTGFFLVLVPLVAICIRCIIGAFQRKVGKDLKHRVINHHRGSKSIRWKTALSDITELDVLDAESGPDFTNPPEDQPPVSLEEMTHAYTKIEPAYQKFLSECGMSESGYWRGGSPD